MSAADVSERAGVDAGLVRDLIEAGLISGDGGGFTAGDVRRVLLLHGLLDGGLPIEAIAQAVHGRVLSLDFADEDAYRRFASLSDETFEAASARTRIPIEWLAVMREVTGWGGFDPGARLREDELDILPWLATQARLGFRRVAVERMLRALGDTLRRLAEAEAEWFRTEIAEPYVAAGRVDEITLVDPQNHFSEKGERALLAVFRAQQAQTWVGNMVAGIGRTLALAGIHEPVEREPAICFLDITGYTRLTQERGDLAASELAEELAKVVKRTSGEHGGRPVKWLGDGVMFHFRDAAPAVLAALEMVEAIPAAGLPPAHVGVHTGPVVIREGDYYGQTVNMAARIADYARPGEVLVSEATVVATGVGGPVVEGGPGELPIAFSRIGSVELKGVSGTSVLYSARPRA
jgi:class 3 adenylate cyclase